jgi:transitional endoplasmic reticulum ATPase
MPLTKDVDLEKINTMLKGYSGADVEGVVREAGMNAIRARRDKVSMNDFEIAIAEVRATVTKEHVERIKRFEEGVVGMYR